MQTTSSGPTVQSPNFWFLAAHDEPMVELAARAERYVFDDPNACFLKLRQLAERIAQYTAEGARIDIIGLAQFDVLQTLVRQRVMPRNVADLFHTIRMSGNDAAHHFEGSQSQQDALVVLELARDIAVWFHRASRDDFFDPGPFVPPPDPENMTRALTEELQRLRQKYAAQWTELKSVKESTAIEATRRHEAEAKAAAAYDELKAALKDAKSPDEKRQSELSLEEVVAAREVTAETAPTPEIEMVVARAEKAASQIDLSETEARRVAETNVREGAWEVTEPTGKPIDIKVPAILFRITKVYREGMTPNEIYEAVRGTWKVDARRDKARYAVAVYKGEVKGVFEIKRWHPAGTTNYETRVGSELKTDGRWEFTGTYADQRMWFEYLGRSVAAYFPQGTMNPVRYVNC
jgi:hypothetical protein